VPIPAVTVAFRGRWGVYLTVLEHEGSSWAVSLKVIPRTDRDGLLQFVFRRTKASEGEPGYLWETSESAFDELYRGGGGLSEEFLVDQLARAMHEQCLAPAP
jgi:hypothetical protein